MRIRNLTPDTRKIKVKGLIGESESYDVYIMPYGSTDLEKSCIIEPKDISGILEVEGIMPIPAIIEDVVEDESEDISEDSPDTSAEQSEDEKKIESAFICEICGAEFASARSLNSHKSRAHAGAESD